MDRLLQTRGRTAGMIMSINPLQAILDRLGVAILDGGLASELERRGANLDDPLWSARLLIEEPNLIRQVHHDYLVAGADIITTASYQASFPAFSQHGLDARQSADLMRLSVDLAKQARQCWERQRERRRDGGTEGRGDGETKRQRDAETRRQGSTPSLQPEIESRCPPVSPSRRLAVSSARLTPLVAASIGCYGAFLHDGSEYRGDYGLTKLQLMDFHRPRLEILAQSQPDLLACETIPCRVEAEALVELLDEVRVPAWISFSCRDEMHTSNGEPLKDCLDLTEASPQVVAAGVNCTAPRFVTRLLDSVVCQVRKPLIVYPNRGETWDAQHRCWVAGPNMPVDWGHAARAWQAAGARIIGGCCRTTPDDIRAMTLALKRST